MANVYKATQIFGVHRTVAIKMLRDEYQNDEEFNRRFRQEAQAVLSLSHENIVHSYEIGEDHGSNYIVLEYIEGKTLKQIILDSGPMLPKSAVQIACQILDALTYAHEHGIVHRDIKPQNVIVTPRGKAKLTDFGIARKADASTMTFAGTNVLGSVHYISPEQARGQAATVQSDLYSMGIMLYEMLTGDVPFRGETSVSIALMHLQQDITPPIEKSNTVSPALSDVVLKATSKNPEDRYMSAKEMRHDLLRALREPNGMFAKVKSRKNRTANHKSASKRGGVGKIALALGITVCIFTFVFLIGRTFLMRTDAQKSELVPKLIGKTLEEAEETAFLRDYTLDVAQSVQDTEYAAGIIVDQQPNAGTSASPGSTIQVTVSTGPAVCIVPNVTGATLQQAEQLLLDAGLQLGEPIYQLSDQPAGLIFKQDPVEGATLVNGDEVRVFVSGEPNQNIEMPSVTMQSLPDALSLLQQRGFHAFRVYLEKPKEGEQLSENTVMRQVPANCELVPPDTLISLTVSDAVPGIFYVDLALNVDIEQTDSSVMVALLCEENGITYETVLYETILSKGQQQPIAFTAYSSTYGDQTLIVYVNGEQALTKDVRFSYRS